MQLRTLVARTIAPVAIAAFIAAGCGGDNGVLGVGGIPSDSFCSVNGVGLKKDAFNDLVDGAKTQFKDSGRDFPKKGSTEYDQLRSQAVDFLVQQQITNDQAEKFGLDVSDKEVDKAEKDLKKQYFNGSDKKFKSELKRSHYTVERVRNDLRNKELSNKLYKKITSDVKVSDADAKKYFEENQDQFVTKESRDVAHILVKTKAEADAIYAQVKGGDQKLFAKLAKAKSQDPGSKDSGGVLPGGVQRGQTVAEFDKVAFELKTGETSPPVKTQFGYHVIQARGPVKPEKKQTYKEVKKQIKDQLKSQKESERFQDWQTDVTNDAKDSVECRDDYIWSKTVDTDKANAEAAKKAAAADKKKSDKADKADKDDKKADDAKSDDAKPADSSGDATPTDSKK
jgi:parvulin-like peptidyl-prolyl isomerase